MSFIRLGLTMLDTPIPNTFNFSTLEHLKFLEMPKLDVEKNMFP